MEKSVNVDAFAARFMGLQIDLPQLGTVVLGAALRIGQETAVFYTDRPDVVVKIFDLDCGVEDEISYGPHVAFQLEVANFEEIGALQSLRRAIPAYHGSGIDYERKYAFVAMEFLNGQDLQEWCDEATRDGMDDAWVDTFRSTVFETFAILERFHENHIVVIDFKPENVLRLSSGSIRFVDMGAFFTPRYLGKTKEYMYSATPDYAELLIDSSNIESGVPLTQASDIFAAGVALFEMVTRESRLTIDPGTADAIRANPSAYLFRESQIRDVWQSYPHLQGRLPLVETQLNERRLLFGEFWHVLRAYLANQVEGWEGSDSASQDAMLMDTGTDFIREHLPQSLHWLAAPVAQATVLRRLRIGSVSELKAMMGTSIDDEIRADLQSHNLFVQYLSDQGALGDFLESLNQWDVRRHDTSGHWSIHAHACAVFLADHEDFSYVVKAEMDFEGHQYYQLAGHDTAFETPTPLAELHDAAMSWVL
jgi:serine/threonine protein kinase